MHLIDRHLELMLQGKFSEAWKISQKLEQLDSDDLRHRFNRGWHLIRQGKHHEGYQMLDCGRFLDTYGNKQLPTTKPIWNQVSLKNKTVILNLEGGYGDQIIYVRFAKEIQNRGGKCIVCCSPELFCLFSRVEGVSQCITVQEVSVTPHDFWIPSFSSSWLFDHTEKTLPNTPYITSKADSNDIWKKIISSDKIKVGIRWSGNPKFEHQQFRIFPAEFLIDLHKYKELQLYSLQRDNDTKELPTDVIDLQHSLLSWEDTCSAIENLDLVITSCTSVAHLAAAMGKLTWIVVPILPYHIWAYGKNHSPWYEKTTRIFRQQEYGNWSKTFAELEKDLVKKYKLSS